MSLALFDLDNTLLRGDSDYAWGQFLVKHEIVNPALYARENARFFTDYAEGRLDINEYAAFCFQPLVDNSIEDLQHLRASYVNEVIEPMMLPRGQQVIAEHRAAGRTVVMITATSSFVTAPIAEAFGIEHLLATDPEQRDGVFTGKISGIPCFQDGKVQRLQQWLQGRALDLQDSYFYSDSRNDIPLLEQVTHAVAVDPDPVLREVATERGWEITSFRD